MKFYDESSLLWVLVPKLQNIEENEKTYSWQNVMAKKHWE